MNNRFFLTFLLVAWSICLALPAGAESSNIVKIGDDITIAKGTEVRNAVAVGGQITISGTVTGDAVSIGNSIVLTKTARVKGDVISVGGVVVRGKGARVLGSVKEISAPDLSQYLTSALDEDWEGWSWVFAVLSSLIFIGILLIGLLLVALLPQPVYAVASAIKDSPLKVFLWGLVSLVSITPLAILLTISVLGIVLIPVEMFLVVCASLVGFIAVAQVAGEKLFALFNRHHQSAAVDIFWGLVILWLIGWIPHIGWLVKVIAVVLGMGGVLAASLGSRQQWKKSPRNKEGENADGGASIS